MTFLLQASNYSKRVPIFCTLAMPVSGRRNIENTFESASKISLYTFSCWKVAVEKESEGRGKKKLPVRQSLTFLVLGNLRQLPPPPRPPLSRPGPLAAVSSSSLRGHEVVLQQGPLRLDDPVPVLRRDDLPTRVSKFIYLFIYNSLFRFLDIYISRLNCLIQVNSFTWMHFHQ